MDEKLLVRAPGVAPVEYLLGDEPLVLGRDKSCDITLPSDYVSRRHMKIERKDGVLVLTDLGGTNPVMVNGERLQGSVELAPGDTLRIADVEMDVLMGGGTVVFRPGDVSTRRIPATPRPEPPPGKRNMWMDQHLGPGGTLCIMFTDVEDSTRLVATMGERPMHQALQVHNAIVREQIRQYRGFEAKRSGDGFLILFASVRDALHCAVGIQRGLFNQPAVNGIRLRVRIGIHVGEVLWDEDDIYGSAVNFAARVGSEARAEEVLVSGVLREIVAMTGEFAFGEDRVVPLKGFDGAYRLTPVLWKDQLEQPASNQ